MIPIQVDETTKSLIYKRLRRSIIMGTRGSGERLNVEEIADEYSTSVTPVRDALQMLSHEGLVDIKPRSGYFVKSITLKQLRDLLDVRRVLELTAIERAALRATEEQIEEMSHVHAGYTGDDEESYDRYTDENRHPLRRTMDLKPIYENVIEGQADEVESGVKSALAAGVEAGKILNEALIAAMDEVGQRFEDGDFFVPEMLISARAMQAGLALLKPHLTSSDIKSSGKIAIGTVKGDLHDIGKNLVAMMLEGAGFEVIDLGVDVLPNRSWTPCKKAPT
jgi:methanogenic corrinoid protein MtbC1